MPKRSNEFQNLVYLLKKQLAEDASVSESKMLKDLRTGAEREIDICVETEVAANPVVVSIECTDRSRPADVKWVDEMKGKHERLPTNALVLISRNGFTPEAVRVAQACNIHTLQFDETTEDDIDRIFGNLESLWTKVFALSPTKVVVQVAATETLGPQRVAVLPDNTIHRHDGSTVGVFGDLVQEWLQSSAIREEFAKQAQASHKAFVVGWRQPSRRDGGSLYLQKIDPPMLQRIELIEVRGTCEVEVSMFPLRHGALGEVKVSWGKGVFAGSDALLVASEDLAGTKRISISVEGTPKTE
jgi:hypothetical protein